MSITLAALRSRVRAKLNDVDMRRPAFNVIAYDQALADAYTNVQSRLPAIHVYTASAFTIAATSETFTLPTTSNAQYRGDVRLQLVSNGVFLYKKTVEEINQYQNGEFGAALLVGVDHPSIFALWEGSTQVVNGICWPRTLQAEAVNMYNTLSAADLRNAADMDAAVIDLSEEGVVGLTYFAAAMLAAGMTEQDLAARRLSKDVAAVWFRESNRVLLREEARHSDLESVGRIMRWVS